MLLVVALLLESAWLYWLHSGILSHTMGHMTTHSTTQADVSIFPAHAQKLIHKA